MGKSLVMEGADGAAKIAALSASYSSNPPTEVDGVAVSGIPGLLPRVTWWMRRATPFRRKK